MRLGGVADDARRPGRATTALVVGPRVRRGERPPDPTPLVPGAAVLYPLPPGGSTPVGPAQCAGHGQSARPARDRLARDLRAPIQRHRPVGRSPRRWPSCEPGSRRGWVGVRRGEFRRRHWGRSCCPWDQPGISGAFLDYPSFGHHPIRLTLPCVGSGQAIRDHGGERHLPVLRYFDAATRRSALPGRRRWWPPPCSTRPCLHPGQFAIHKLLGRRTRPVRPAGCTRPKDRDRDRRGPFG